MTKPLYEISDQYLDALEHLADLEVDEETIHNTLEAIHGEVEEKSIAVAKFFQNLDAEAKSIDEAMKRMTLRKKALANHSNRMKAYLKENMERTGITKIACPYFELAVVKNPASVGIDDEDAIPEEYIQTKVVKSVDKRKIREDLDHGKDVPGAHIQRTTRLRIK